VVTSGRREVERDRIGVGDEEVQTSMKKINNLQGPIVQHRELVFSVFLIHSQEWNFWVILVTLLLCF